MRCGRVSVMALGLVCGAAVLVGPLAAMAQEAVPGAAEAAKKEEKIKELAAEQVAGSAYGAPEGMGRGVYELAERPWEWVNKAVGQLAARPDGDPLLLTDEQVEVLATAQVTYDAKSRNWAIAHGSKLKELRSELDIFDRRLTPEERQRRRDRAQEQIDRIDSLRPDHDRESSQVWVSLTPDQRVAVLWDLATADSLAAPVPAPNVTGMNPRRVLIQGYLDDIGQMSDAIDDHDITVSRFPGRLKPQLLAADEPTRRMAMGVIEGRLRVRYETLPRGDLGSRQRDGGPPMR